MSAIEKLIEMLRSRSSDYGTMYQLASSVMLMRDKRVAELEGALRTAYMYADKLSDEWPLQKHVKDKMRKALEGEQER